MREDVLVKVVRGELASTTSQLPVAAHPDDPDRRMTKLERAHRRVARLLERWDAGELRFDDLMARLRPVAQALVEAEREALLPVDAKAAQHLVAEWDSLDPLERRRLLRAMIAEIVIVDAQVRVTRRRQAITT